MCSHWGVRVLALLFAVAWPASHAHAQTAPTASGAQVPLSSLRASSVSSPWAWDFAASADDIDLHGRSGVPARRILLPPHFQPTPAARRPRSVARKVTGGILGAVGGFFGGGFLGAAIEGDRCECDDPGFVGFLIGAPTGAVIGGIVGAKFF
jgi:hypothetical protein